MPALARTKRTVAPYALDQAKRGQTSLLDLFDDAPVVARQEPAFQQTSKPKTRTTHYKPDPEASLLNLLFDEPEAAEMHDEGGRLVHKTIPRAAPLPTHGSPSRPIHPVGVNEEQNPAHEAQILREARARFDDPNLLPIAPAQASNQNNYQNSHGPQADLAPLVLPTQSTWRPVIWLYLGALVGGGLAMLFGVVFFPLSPLQGFETVIVRGLFGAALGTLWGVLPYLLHARQSGSAGGHLDEAQVYTSWQTRGQIVAD